MSVIYNVDWVNGVVGAILGVIASSAIALLVRLYTTAFDFIPRRLLTLSIGSSLEPFRARGPGDNYNATLMVYIRNQSGSPLYIVRAVYFRGAPAKRLPLYPNARRSQKYPRGYELKFGAQWVDSDVLLPAHGQVDTYIPLQSVPVDDAIPVGKRGTLLLEYVSEGRPGVHRGSL
jgi:hypothetical protein